MKIVITIVLFLKELNHQPKKQRWLQEIIKQEVKKQNLKLKVIESPIIAEKKL